MSQWLVMHLLATATVSLSLSVKCLLQLIYPPPPPAAAANHLKKKIELCSKKQMCVDVQISTHLVWAFKCVLAASQNKQPALFGWIWGPSFISAASWLVSHLPSGYCSHSSCYCSTSSFNISHLGELPLINVQIFKLSVSLWLEIYYCLTFISFPQDIVSLCFLAHTSTCGYVTKIIF